MDVPLISLVSAISLASPVEKDLLQDPGFEEVQEPDRYGNPFRRWGGWKWEGDCERRADSKVKHGGRSSGLLAGRSACKVAFSETLDLEPGRYRLSGWMRAIGLRKGTWDRTAMIALEPPGAKEIEDVLPEGSFGWTGPGRAATSSSPPARSSPTSTPGAPTTSRGSGSRSRP